MSAPQPLPLPFIQEDPFRDPFGDASNVAQDTDDDEFNSMFGTDAGSDDDEDTAVDEPVGEPGKSSRPHRNGVSGLEPEAPLGAMGDLNLRDRARNGPDEDVYEVDAESNLCVICKDRPKCSNGRKTYPTCGLTCAARYQSSGFVKSLCVVCGVRQKCSKGSTTYTTCGLSCATKLQTRRSSLPKCVVCDRRRVFCKGTTEYPTCGLKCAMKLTSGGASKKMCSYCHRVKKEKNQAYCGQSCRDKAKRACLLCRSRPKNGRYHFCGRQCRNMAAKEAPLLLEVPPDHVTFEMVETKFKEAWKMNRACPTIRKVYKVVESAAFLAPYDAYRRSVGNQVFRYHGTKRGCKLGDEGHTKLCKASTCAACSILNTSFKVSLANVGGAFGQGVYTSSATNKSASYAPTGVMFLTKVVLGTVRYVNAFAEVKACPPGFHSVVFDRQNGQLNETIVYRDDAIRPVFLIIFG